MRQNQAGATLEHRLESGGTLSANVYSGMRAIKQFLSIPLSVQLSSPTQSGGVVDLNRDFGGGGLRYTRDASLAGRPLTLNFGAEYERMAEHRRGYINDLGVEGALRRDEDDTVSSSAVYAQAQWHFAAKWIALGGVRANRVAFDSVDHYIVPGNPDDSGGRNFNATTPVIGLLYRAAPATSVYVNYGRGFETPTFAEMAYNPSGATGLNFGLEPSKSRSTEVGVKTLIGSRVRLNATLYNVETENEIVVDTSSGGRTTYTNAGRTRRRGIELSAGASLPLGIEASLAWTILNTEVLDGYTSSSGDVAAGNVLPGVPRATLYGKLSWRAPASGFNVLLEAQHRSQVAVDDVNSAYADAYTVANFAFGFEQRAGKWDTSEFVRVNNLADTKYIGSVIVNASADRYYEPAPGRNAMVGVQAKLGF